MCSVAAIACEFAPPAMADAVPRPRLLSTSEIPAPLPVESYAGLPRFEPMEPCFIPIGATPHRCGYVVVPADRSQPGGQTIHLGVVVFESQTRPAAADPILFARGGPGGSVMALAEFAQVFQPDWFTQPNQTRDLIFFDQRGTAFARPHLNCPGYGTARIQSAQRGASTEQTAEAIAEAIQACAQPWEQQGWDLSVFNSLETAADINDIRSVLGYDQINFFGSSYGTMLGQHLMYRYPEILRSVTLDSPFPLSANWGGGQAPLRQQVLEQVFAACTASEACRTAYPDLEERTEQLHASLQQQPLTVTLQPQSQLSLGLSSEGSLEVPVNGDLLSTALIDSLYTPEGVASFPYFIEAVEQGNIQVLGNEFGLSLQPDDTLALLMHFTVVCAEDADYRLEDVRFEGAGAIARGYSHLDTLQYLKVCDRLQLETLPASVDSPVVSDIPTLVLSGQFDPATPPSLLSQILPTLGNAYSYTFPDGAHGQLWPFGNCSAQIFDRFIQNPLTAPDGTCVEAGSLEFYIPQVRWGTGDLGRKAEGRMKPVQGRLLLVQIPQR
ncbi:MAG: alpha/beta fold hydrolase [Cyanobacteria bacterium J06626_18]